MIERIVSGGQTGVDRGALDAALDAGVSCGGWCPAGRRAEDGVIADRYPLCETPEADPAQRTDWNVRDSDATLVLLRGEPTGGSAYSLDCAQARKRPVQLIQLPDEASDAALETLAQWIGDRAIRVLNVSGPRESQALGIQAEVRELVSRLLRTRTR
ncbi:MAG: putative molybdenum carrier protein [Myxococcales bacterium]|nr:putative molybdenum carrier protein [Myxococcales bacterium]